MPYLDNEAWVESLNQPVVKPWTAWNTPNNQIGGYVTQYAQITFATVRGAGHMVPQTRPVSSGAEKAPPPSPLAGGAPQPRHPCLARRLPPPQAGGLAVFNSLITGVPLA